MAPNQIPQLKVPFKCSTWAGRGEPITARMILQNGYDQEWRRKFRIPRLSGGLLKNIFNEFAISGSPADRASPDRAL